MVHEATRLIEVTFKIIPRDKASLYTRSRRPPGDTLDGKYPPIFFSGYQRGVREHEATVDGCVRMGGDYVAKWQYVSLNASTGGHFITFSLQDHDLWWAFPMEVGLSHGPILHQ